jgi:hypothetical protein
MQATDYPGRLRRFVGLDVQPDVLPTSRAPELAAAGLDIVVAPDELTDALATVPGEVSTGA